MIFYSTYIDAVYQVFFHDFMLHKAQFGSHRLHLRYHPAFQERPYAFYHMTHKGNIEDERLPDLRRCERMPWARPTVERTEALGLRFWEQSERRNGRRICIWLNVDNGDDYFVILYVHRRYVRLLTAFYGDSPNYAKKRLKEYEDWQEKVGAISLRMNWSATSFPGCRNPRRRDRPNKKQGPPFDDPETSFDNLVNEM